MPVCGRWWKILGPSRRRVFLGVGSLSAGQYAGEVVPAVDNPRIPRPFQTASIAAQTGLEKKGDGELGRKTREWGEGEDACG